MHRVVFVLSIQMISLHYVWFYTDMHGVQNLNHNVALIPSGYIPDGASAMASSFILVAIFIFVFLPSSFTSCIWYWLI